MSCDPVDQLRQEHLLHIISPLNMAATPEVKKTSTTPDHTYTPQEPAHTCWDERQRMALPHLPGLPLAFSESLKLH